MDELEINPLYKCLLTKFRREFEIAVKMSYTIAIPQSSTIDEQQIDLSFVSAHILMPSKLLKSHFNPLLAGRDFGDIEMEDNKLICSRNDCNKQRSLNMHEASDDKLVIKILAQEMGYTERNREFRILIIDRPLVYNQPIRRQSTVTLFRTLLRPLSGSQSFVPPRRAIELPPVASVQTRELSRKHQRIVTGPLKSHDDCLNRLKHLSPSVLNELELDIKRMEASYSIHSDYLNDIAERLKQLATTYTAKFEQVASQAQSRVSLEPAYWRNICLAVESFVVHQVHDKLMAAIHEHCEKEDKLLLEKMAEMSRARLTVRNLGAQTHFSHFHASDELLHQIRQLPFMQSPISIVNGLLKLAELVSTDLDQSVEFRRLMCGVDTPECENKVVTSLWDQYNQPAVSVCSDDLIATLVCSLVRARPKKFFSLIKYLELFGWTLISRDQAAYFLATIQIAVHYVMSWRRCEQSGTEIDHDLSETRRNNNRTSCKKVGEALGSNSENLFSFEYDEVYASEPAARLLKSFQ